MSNKKMTSKETKYYLISLIERDTLKKVEVKPLTYYKYPICPNCKIDLNINYYKQKYCDNCGQRLDWGEYNEW